jgi:hypothetical protein
MVGHQHIGMYRTACIMAILLQPIKVTTVILVGIKTGLPIISALDQMQGNAGYDDARSSRHKYNLSLFHLIGYQKNVVCPLFLINKGIIVDIY